MSDGNGSEAIPDTNVVVMSLSEVRGSLVVLSFGAHVGSTGPAIWCQGLRTLGAPPTRACGPFAQMAVSKLSQSSSASVAAVGGRGPCGRPYSTGRATAIRPSLQKGNTDSRAPIVRLATYSTLFRARWSAPERKEGEAIVVL